MLYNQLNIHKQPEFSTQGGGPGRPNVIVYYNSTGIHEITGPVPVMDISYSYNSNNVDIPETLTTSITLNGKIFRKPEGGNIDGVDSNKAMPGLSGVLAGVSGLRDLFVKCPLGTISVQCPSSQSTSSKLYEISGVRVTSLQFNNTPDNWVQTADYSITLEKIESLLSDPSGNVTDKQDSWSIEPLEDNTYVDISIPSTGKYEYSNPAFGRTNSSNTVTPGGSSSTDPETFDIKIKNIPQFRISRRLSAKGIIPVTGCSTDLYRDTTRAYVYAKAWVESMHKKTFKNANSSTNSSTPSTPSDSAPYFTNPYSNDLVCYNHNRTINIDIFNGTYETNDTWLAMPSGVPYTETYTVETSNGEDYVKTVRVAGSIIGLELSNYSFIQDSGIVVPSGTGNNGLINAELKLHRFMVSGAPGIGGSWGAFDGNIGASSSGPNTGSSYPPAQNTTSNKYLNALNAWTYHIKPFLYRRATLVLNRDRSLDYVPSYATNPPQKPNNPIYSRETLLSVIPVSTSEGHDPKKGTINYTYEFNNKLNIISGVITENINVSYDNPIDNTTEVQVIGRSLGPIIQRTGRSTPKKTLSIEIGIPPVTGIEQVALTNQKCPLHRSGFLFQTIEKIIEAHRPYSPSTFLDVNTARPTTSGLVYTSSDNESWNPTSGKYSRNISWTYQQSSMTHDFRNH